MNSSASTHEQSKKRRRVTLHDFWGLPSAPLPTTGIDAPAKTPSEHTDVLEDGDNEHYESTVIRCEAEIPIDTSEVHPTDQLQPPIYNPESLRTEGVDLQDPLCILRQEKCHALIDEALSNCTMLIRSPPYTGKTSLGYLVSYAASSVADLIVYRFTCLSLSLIPRSAAAVSARSVLDELRCMNDPNTTLRLAINNIQTSREETKVLLIIDEAQMLYADAEFAAVVKLAQQTHRRTWGIIFLAAYGERDPAGKINPSFGTPFGMSSVYGFETLAFTHAEFEELMDKFQNKYPTLQLSTTVKDAVGNITGRSPGLLRSCLHSLQFAMTTSAYLRDASASQEVKAMHFLTSIFPGIVAERRGCPNFDITADRLQILMALFEDRELNARVFPESVHLVKMGVNYINQKGHLRFTSPVIQSVVMARVFRGISSVDVRNRPPTLNDEFADLLLYSISRFSVEILNKSLSAEASGVCFERQLQMQFYRASIPYCQWILFADCFPDVGKIFGSTGYLDFYVNSKRNWAVELTRDGDRLEEHIERFAASGKYATIPIQRWAVINFVQQIPEEKTEKKKEKKTEMKTEPPLLLGEMRVYYQIGSEDFTVKFWLQVTTKPVKRKGKFIS